MNGYYMQKHELMQQLFLLAVLTAFSFSCKSSPTGPHINQNLQLSADYVTCTEVWLKLGFTGSASGGEYKITRDTTTVLTGSLSGAVTVVIDTTAQPEMTYTYRAYRIVNNGISDTSLPLQVTTLDTTSNNFTWQAFTFGEPGSTLKDVAIINDTDIVCTGAVYLKDSTGQVDPSPYCLAHWNGSIWNLIRLKFLPPGSIGDSVTAQGYSIFANNANDIWMAEGALFHYDGNKFSEVLAFNSVWGPYRVNRIWESPDKKTYVVGDSGAIAQYNGSSWQRLNSGTNSNFQNIWGSDGKVIAITYESKVLTISGSMVQDTLNWTGNTLRGIWFGDNTPVYVSGVGVWKSELGAWREMNGLPYYYYTGIRGNGVNDLFAIGWSGMAAHYNGSTWHIYNEVANPAWDYESLAVNGNITAIVGFEAEGAVVGKALAIIGKR